LTTAAPVERVGVRLQVLGVYDGSRGTCRHRHGVADFALRQQVMASFAPAERFADWADSMAMRWTWQRPHDTGQVVRQYDLDVDEPVTRGEG
jgi:hypothetical protein